MDLLPAYLPALPPLGDYEWNLGFGLVLPVPPNTCAQRRRFCLLECQAGSVPTNYLCQTLAFATRRLWNSGDLGTLAQEPCCLGMPVPACASLGWPRRKMPLGVAGGRWVGSSATHLPHTFPITNCSTWKDTTHSPKLERILFELNLQHLLPNFCYIPLLPSKHTLENLISHMPAKYMVGWRRPCPAPFSPRHDFYLPFLPFLCS